MPLDLVAYAYVEAGGNRPHAEVYSVSAAIKSYLEGHVTSLMERARRGSAARAIFTDQGAHALFETLRNGPEGRFLDLTQELAERLQDEMDNRSKRGFLVALRRSLSGNGKQSAALKLDIHDEVAAAARRAQDGRLTLEAVADLLDVQGALQKGAVFPDTRQGSQVVVGDRVTVDTALYFLRTLQVRQFAKESNANRLFMTAISDVSPASAGEIAEALNAEASAVSPRQFLEAHSDLIPELEREEVLQRISDTRHPVGSISPAKPISETIRAEGIEIKGRVEAMADRVRVKETLEGWEITVRARTRPQRHFS